MLRRSINTSLLFITLLIINVQPIFSQDTTRTIAGQGFIHYSISNPAGPFFIQILEIDLTIPGNKLTTALAKDKLGDGFERTSALSSRKSISGNVVVGAVNGDFYGISAPNNPYGFLANSQIINSEYVFGRSHIRSSFGVIDDTKPVVQVIDFTGTATSASQITRSITGFNSQRGTDALILFNKYFGSTTLTNQYGTEVELQPVDSFVTNSNLRFVVLTKHDGVGSMPIQPGKYILSGHGVSKSFLDQSVFVDDTITLFIGTSPDLGNVTALIGGGPRLIIDGSKPPTFVGFEGFGSDFVNTRHPRTAAGYNEDSTKAFFVVVDGRQAGLSVGMSLNELADLMLSMGAYNAVNLDGGGSSTMVVHNQVVNSPSDPGGERSVANALFAVSEMEISTPVLPNLLQPENGAVNQRDTIVFIWNKSEYAAVYDLQVSTNPNFSTNIIISKSIIMDTTYTVSGFQGLQNYYWRVRAKNAVGTSGFTQGFSFQTGFPGVPVLIYPPHATTNVSTSPTLMWAKESVAESYRVQLALGSTIVPANTILDTVVVQDTTLEISGLEQNRLHYWRVSASNQFGSSNWSATIGFKTGFAVSVGEKPVIPAETYLEQNYPNPFNPATTIKFSLEEDDEVILKVYNALGSEIETLAEGGFSRGSHSVDWNAADFSSGIYFYTMITGSGKTFTRRMVLIK